MQPQNQQATGHDQMGVQEVQVALSGEEEAAGTTGAAAAAPAAVAAAVAVKVAEAAAALAAQATAAAAAAAAAGPSPLSSMPSFTSDRSCELLLFSAQSAEGAALGVKAGAAPVVPRVSGQSPCVTGGPGSGGGAFPMVASRLGTASQPGRTVSGAMPMRAGQLVSPVSRPASVAGLTSHQPMGPWAHNASLTGAGAAAKWHAAPQQPSPLLPLSQSHASRGSVGHAVVRAPSARAKAMQVVAILNAYSGGQSNGGKMRSPRESPRGSPGGSGSSTLAELLGAAPHPLARPGTSPK